MPSPSRPLFRPSRWLLPLLLAALVGCGGVQVPDPDPDPDPTLLRQVDGVVLLPEGLGWSLEGTSVVTAHGRYPVAPDGAFRAELSGTASTEVGLEDEAGRLLLLGLSDDAGLEVSAERSALVLLHQALGGFALPAEHQEALWRMLAESAEADGVAATLAAALLEGDAPLVDGSVALEVALEGARAALIPSLASTLRSAGPAPTAAPSSSRPAASAAAVDPIAASGAQNVVLSPDASVLQSGAAVLHNPEGAGIAVQNHFRRPLSLLAYQVAYDDAGEQRQELTPPLLAGRVEVPATGKLELFTAIGDVVSGDAPWTPVLSEGLTLPLRDGRRTYYELVLVGPTLDWVTRPPLLDDLRFIDQRDGWEQIVTDRSVQLFLEELVLPLLESYMFGRVGVVQAGKLDGLRQGFLRLNDPYLAALGLSLRAGGGYAQGLGFVLDELAHNNRYRLDFMDMVGAAMEESQRNQVDFQAAESRLRGRASASAIAAAVQIALSAGDVAAILHDLQSAIAVVSWQATASPTLFVLSPEEAYFTKGNPQIELSVNARGPVGGPFAYRWSTTGRHGQLVDGPRKGLSFDTPYPNVWYTHNDPTHISDEQKDTVVVEVFEVASAGAPIPAGAQPMARMTAELRGFDREIDSRLSVRYGVTPPGYFREEAAVCATMYLRIPKQAGAKSYEIRFSNWGYQHPRNSNSYLFHNGSYTWRIDPANPDGTIWPMVPVCDWFGPDGQSYLPPHNFHTYDDGEAYMLAIFVNFNLGDQTQMTIAEYVRLWYDWASRGGLNVEYVR